MARPRRLFVNKGVYFVTNRVAEGLPFAANLYINLLLLGILVRAQYLYSNIVICAWLFMGNHYHGIIVLKGSEAEAAAFMQYMDGEIAKLVNRLRGVCNRNVWARRYDAQAILTPEAVIEKLAYIFLNPIRANLVERIEQYPGANTWHEFLGKKQRLFKWISSSLVSRLPSAPFTKCLLRPCLSSISLEHRGFFPLLVSPFAWKESFPESKTWKDEEIKTKVISKVREGEIEQMKKRRKDGIGVIGAERLRTQDFHMPYVSKTYGKRGICISTCQERRRQYIAEYRAFCEKCREVWEKWRRGDFLAKYPPGAFQPPRAPTASLITLC